MKAKELRGNKVVAAALKMVKKNFVRFKLKNVRILSRKNQSFFKRTESSDILVFNC